MSEPDYLLVVDLECTCHARGTAPTGFFSEIIEIGAVLVDMTALHPTWEFCRLVRPRFHPNLSAFCTRLTTITQAQVDNGIDLAAALDDLRQQPHFDRALFTSWGFYDRHMFEDACERYGLKQPFSAHISLKHEHAAYFRRAPIGMARALNHLGLALEGTHHRGIDDARNISRIATRLWQMGWRPAFVGPDTPKSPPGAEERNSAR